MKKAWRIIIVIVLVAILLGAVSVGVGFMTGADADRIISVLDSRYNVVAWFNYFTQDIPQFISELFGSLLGSESAGELVAVETVTG